MHKTFEMFAASLGLVALLSGSVVAASPTPTPKTAPKMAAKPAVPIPAPTPPPKIHVVAAGDSLSIIATEENLDSWRPLWDANPGVTDPDVIYEGQQLTVPVGPVPERPLPANAVAPVTRSVAAPVAAQPHPGVTANYAAGVGGILANVRMRESGGNYATNTGNGYYGAYQFSLSTWYGVGGSGLPSDASPAEQDMRAQTLYNARGCSPWPNTCY